MQDLLWGSQSPTVTSVRVTPLADHAVSVLPCGGRALECVACCTVTPFHADLSVVLPCPGSPLLPLHPPAPLLCSLLGKQSVRVLSLSVCLSLFLCLSVCLSLHATTPPPSLCLKVVHVLKGSVLRIVLFMAPAETVTCVCACVCVCMCVNDMIGLASWVTEILNTRLTLYSI